MLTDEIIYLFWLYYKKYSTDLPFTKRVYYFESLEGIFIFNKESFDDNNSNKQKAISKKDKKK